MVLTFGRNRRVPRIQEQVLTSVEQIRLFHEEQQRRSEERRRFLHLGLGAAGLGAVTFGLLRSSDALKLQTSGSEDFVELDEQVAPGTPPTGKVRAYVTSTGFLLSKDDTGSETTYERQANKAAASGYASLNASTRVPTAELGSGVADAASFLRGDSSWQKVAQDLGCRVRKSANQSIPNATVTTVTWDTEDYDTDTMHDNVTNNTRLTIQTAGKYLIVAQSNWASNNTGTRIARIRKNGVDYLASFEQPSNLANEASAAVSLVANFIAGDYLEFTVYQDSGGALNFQSSSNVISYMAAQKIDRGG